MTKWLVRNRDQAMIWVALAGVLWIAAVRNFFRFLPGVRLRRWHLFDALGEYAWAGYLFVWLCLLVGLIGFLLESEGKERALFVCLIVELVLFPAKRMSAGLLLTLVQFSVVADFTALLIITVLILRDRWKVEAASQE